MPHEFCVPAHPHNFIPYISDCFSPRSHITSIVPLLNCYQLLLLPQNLLFPIIICSHNLLHIIVSYVIVFPFYMFDSSFMSHDECYEDSIVLIMWRSPALHATLLHVLHTPIHLRQYLRLVSKDFTMAYSLSPPPLVVIIYKFTLHSSCPFRPS